MAEPVLQGVVQSGHTRFLVLPPGTGVDGESLEDSPSHGSSTSAGSEHSTEQDDDVEDEDDDEDSASDGFDIDESFLATSVLAPPRLRTAPSTPLSPPPRTASLAGNSLALVNSHSTSEPQHFPSITETQLATVTAPTGTVVRPHALQQPIASELLVPRPKSDDDDTPRVYLRTGDVGRLGLFSGDWVVLGGEEDEGRRLARVFAEERVAGEGSAEGRVFLSQCAKICLADTVVHNRLVNAYLPPTLLHNLHASSDSISLTPSRLTAPAFPVAHSVNVARIASPHSVHRAYQSLFLEGLKNFFQSRRRILKKGDVIAVGICEDTARFAEGKTEDDDVE